MALKIPDHCLRISFAASHSEQAEERSGEVDQWRFYDQYMATDLGLVEYSYRMAPASPSILIRSSSLGGPGSIGIGGTTLWWPQFSTD